MDELKEKKFRLASLTFDMLSNDARILLIDKRNHFCWKCFFLFECNEQKERDASIEAKLKQMGDENKKMKNLVSSN